MAWRGEDVKVTVTRRPSAAGGRRVWVINSLCPELVLRSLPELGC